MQVLLLDEVTVDMDVVARLDLLEFFRCSCCLWSTKVLELQHCTIIGLHMLNFILALIAFGLELEHVITCSFCLIKTAGGMGSLP